MGGGGNLAMPPPYQSYAEANAATFLFVAKRLVRILRLASWLIDLQILEKHRSMTKPLAIVICRVVPGYMVSCYLLIEKRCLGE